MRTSKYVKVDTNIIIEYIYDNQSFLLEGYNVLTNLKDDYNQFYSDTGTKTKNGIENQLFRLDPVKNIWTKIDYEKYGFLGVRNYGSSIPIRFDTLKVHLPVNYTFGGNYGFHIKVYSVATRTNRSYLLSSFFFDITNQAQSDFLQYNSPPLLIQEKLWQKNIEVQIPSLFFISSQKTLGLPTESSVNYNLSDGMGVSDTSPIFIEFSFITSRQTVLNEVRYTLGSTKQISIPQTPEFENLSVMIEPSQIGDFFEIYGTYNNTLAEFARFIEESRFSNKRYNVEYNITLFEQNVRSKTQKIYLDEYFDQKIEYRPIIRYSTTTAVIECEMKLINLVDDSIISRRASYGLLPDEVAKYSLKLTKINLDGANKPKIYAIKNQLGAGILELNDKRNRGSRRGEVDVFGNSQIKLEFLKVPFPLFIDKFNLVAKSDSVEIGREIFYSDGALRLVIYPFDNVIMFTIADRISDTQIEYLNLSNSSDVRLVFKSDIQSASFPLWDGNNGQIDLERGTVCFMIPQSRISDIQRIFETGRRVFYITTTNNQITTPIFSGTFVLFDSVDYIEELILRNRAEEPEIDLSSEGEDIVIAVPETGLTSSFVNTSSLDTNQGELASDFLSQFGNLDKILQETNIPPGSILGSLINLNYRNNVAQDTTKVELYYKIITSQQDAEVLINFTVDELLFNSNKYSKFEFARNKTIGKALVFPRENSLTNTTSTDPSYNQTVEFAIFIPSSGLGNTLNLFPKAIKLNNNNLFVTISTWSVLKQSTDTEGTLYKFSLTLKPADKLDIYIDFEPGDSSNLSGFVGLPSDNVISVAKDETLTYRGRVGILVTDLRKTIFTPTIVNTLRSNLNILSDENEQSLFNRLLLSIINEMKQRGLYLLDYPCTEIKFQKILLLLELAKKESEDLDQELKLCQESDSECRKKIRRRKLAWAEIVDQIEKYQSLCQ
jgi:hypothetical protein